MSRTAQVELEVRDPALALLLGNPLLEIIADGFAFVEGPVWHPREQCLFFTDIAGDRIHRWDETTGLSVFRDPSRMANGLALDREGRMLVCEHASSSLTRTDADGWSRILADRYDGKELNSPNDVIVSRNGTIYFTDPAYGREEFWGVPRAEELNFRGVYAIDPDAGSLRLLADDFVAPNGLCLSADEAFLFVNDSERGHIRRFSIRPDGTLAGDVVWARLDEVGPGSPDGMKFDRAGNLFCCGPGGIHVLSPEAQCLGVIRMPEFAANLAFGGAGLRDLFITATTSLYRLRLATGGPV